MHKQIASFCIISFFLVSKIALAETIQINFTGDDSYSIEVAHIDVGDTIEWLPDDEGHNVEFLAGPTMNSLPEKSKLNAFHSVVFKIPGIYLYQCTPHKAMGMIGLVVVSNDKSNLDKIKKVKVYGKSKKLLKKLLKSL